MILQTITATLLFMQAAGGSIGGTVVDGTTGQPIADARIELTRAPAPPNTPQTAPPTAQQAAPAAAPPAAPVVVRVVRIPPVTSDSNGRYAFQNLEWGPYVVRVIKEGYADQPTAVGANSTSVQVTLSEKEPSKNVAFRIIPGAAISGRVDGPDGRPVGSMEVALFVSRYDPEGRQIYQLTTYANTDDRGEYRIFPVNPGQYYLSVGAPTRPIPSNRQITPFNNQKNRYPRVFFPNAPEPETASLIEVQPRGDLSGMNFRLSEQPTFRIRGRVVDSVTGKVPENVGISIVLRESNINTSSSSSGNIVNPTDGSFELQNIAPGRYIIRAQPALVLRLVSAQPGAAAAVPPNVTPGVAIATVDVTSRDVDGVLLAFAPPLAITGRLQMQNGTPVPAGTRANFALRPSTLVPLVGSPGTSRWNPDGSFTLDGVAPGEYFVSVIPVRTGNSPLMYVREARAGEVDLLVHSMVVVGPRPDEIVITLGQNGGQITGSINRPSGETTDRIVLVPNDRSRRDLYKTTAITSNGSFTLQGVPPGAYKIFALAGVAGAPWFDPAFLSPIEANGTTLSVSESATVSVNLNLLRRP